MSFNCYSNLRDESTEKSTEQNLKRKSRSSFSTTGEVMRPFRNVPVTFLLQTHRWWREKIKVMDEVSDFLILMFRTLGLEVMLGRV